VFGILDRGGDIVAPGAFKKSTWPSGSVASSCRRCSGSTTPSSPIGVWDDLEEDNKGLG
jgi:hypothetical protein